MVVAQRKPVNKVLFRTEEGWECLVNIYRRRLVGNRLCVILQEEGNTDSLRMFSKEHWEEMKAAIDDIFEQDEWKVQP